MVPELASVGGDADAFITVGRVYSALLLWVQEVMMSLRLFKYDSVMLFKEIRVAALERGIHSFCMRAQGIFQQERCERGCC